MKNQNHLFPLGNHVIVKIEFQLFFSLKLSGLFLFSLPLPVPLPTSHRIEVRRVKLSFLVFEDIVRRKEVYLETVFYNVEPFFLNKLRNFVVT